MARRDEILQAAFEILGGEGLEALHARTVAAKLKINHATVHYYFPQRPDLLVGAAEFAVAQLAKDRASLGPPESPREAIENELALTEAYAKPGSRMGRAVMALAAARHETPSLAPHLEQWMGLFESALAEALPNAKLRKSTPYADASLLAATLFGIVAVAHLKSDGAAAAGSQLDGVFSSLFKEQAS